MKSLFPRSHADANAIDQEIARPKGRDVRQKSSAQKPPARAYKRDAISPTVCHIQTERSFSQSCTPRRTLESRKVPPRNYNEKAKANVKEPWPKLHKYRAWRHARPQVQKIVGDSHGHGQERDEDGERNCQNDKVNHRRSKA